MFRKDCFRLIGSSYKRFLSLFSIVSIGVAMMVGLLSTVPIMRHSVSKDYREYRVSDVEIFSHLGFSRADVLTLKRRYANSSEVLASRFVDAYSDQGVNGSVIIRAEELERNVDRFALIEGRLPQKENEALVASDRDINKGYHLGESLKLYYKSGNLQDELKNAEFTIVGFVRSPHYMTHLKETSTLDNQELNTIIYIKNDNFVGETYKRVSMRFLNSDDKQAFTPSYEQTLEPYLEQIEELGIERSALRSSELKREAQQKIQEAKQKLQDKVADAKKEIADHEEKWHQAESELKEARQQLDKGHLELEKARAELEDAQNKISENEQKLKDSKQRIEQESGMSFEELLQSMQQAIVQKQQVEKALQQVNQGLALVQQYEEAQNQAEQLRRAIDQIDLALQMCEKAIHDLQKQIAQENDPSLRQEYQQQLVLKQQEYAQYQAQKKDLEQQLTALQAALTKMQEMLSTLDIAQLKAQKTQLEETLRQLNNIITPTFMQRYTSLLAWQNGQKQLAEANERFRVGSTRYQKEKNKLDKAETDYASFYHDWQEGGKELADAKERLETETAKAEKDIRKAENDLANLPASKWIVLGPNKNYHRVFYKNTLQQMSAIARVIPVLFYLVAALVCLTTMTRLLEEERSQIGLYSALGFSKHYIAAKYMVYALLASVGGSILGCFLGISLLPFIIYHEWNLMYTLPPQRFILKPEVIVLGTASFAILMVVVSAFVAYRSLQESPSQLMRPKAPKKIRKTLIEKIPFIWKRLGFISRITGRNIFRYKSRFLMTVIGVAGCTGLLILGFGIKDSLKGIIDLQYGEIFHYAQQIHLREGYDSLRWAQKEKVEGIPFGEYTAKVLIEKAEDTINVEVYQEKQVEKALSLRNRTNGVHYSLPKEGILISEKFALNHHLHVGSYIRLESAEGKLADIEVKGIIEMYFQHFAFLSQKAYEQAFREKAPLNQLAITENTSYPKGNEAIESVTDFKPFIANFQNMIQALDIIILVVILAAGSLAFVVLNNLTQVNIAERTREIATLKVLGFSEKEVRQYIHKEIFILSFIGACLGCPLGKLEHHFVMQVINMEQIMFGQKIALSSYAISFGITLLFTFVVLWITRFSLRKIAMIESLKSVE